ncbi:hypothetical protein OKA04_16745 [Luteolibacter flavescens]|uniref:Uncharacterized protein n=1 Tax=Luteolibacter flavescens TaxID=1859460 RepID=A0ABT3FS33_9BACT|nr:hypothetical protein [Luteolibacter flavescens]MCW1886388.1 hypothetical protein [Luteolibacter flavescens]
MPADEVIGAIIAPVATIVGYVFGALGHLTGSAFLTIITLGRLDLAPLDALFEENRFRKKKQDVISSIFWRHQPGKRRALKAGWVCFVGLLLWVVIGVGTYQVLKSQPAEVPDMPVEAEDDWKPTGID